MLYLNYIGKVNPNFQLNLTLTNVVFEYGLFLLHNFFIFSNLTLTNVVFESNKKGTLYCYKVI